MDNIPILNRSTEAATPKLMRDWRSAVPFKHVVIDEFFDPAFCQALLAGFPPFDNARAMNENGEIGLKCTYDNVRELADPYIKLDDWIQKQSFLEWVGQITGIPDLLYDPHYFGGGGGTH